MTSRAVFLCSAALTLTILAGCAADVPENSVRASGSVEATEVQVSSKVGGPLVEIKVAEGDRVTSGQLIARLDVTDTQLAIRRAETDRDQAVAQLRLLQAGARAEDIRQADAQVKTAEAEVVGARDDLAASETDFGRFDTLLKTSSGSQKQRDDAANRRDLARARLAAAEERVRAARENLLRLRNGARREEVAAAQARVASAEAQIATLEQQATDATVTAPSDGIVTKKLVEAGEILAPRTAIVTVVDLDHAWANIYVDEPLVPRLRLGQEVMLHTDAGGSGLKGTITFISPKAEFTPRNVQTAEERSKLVYRIKVSVDNRQGVLKQGMPVEADVPLITGQ